MNIIYNNSTVYNIRFMSYKALELEKFQMFFLKVM